MGTITKEVMKKQAKAKWFSSLTDERRNGLLMKYGIKKTIEGGTLLNEDVFFIYDEEHEFCESCEKECELSSMRMDDGNWFCNECI